MLTDTQLALCMLSIRDVLTPGLLSQAERRRLKPDSPPSTGHCYAASEALYHMLGGKKAGLKAMVARVRGRTHWWLVMKDGRILDPTYDQFKQAFPYEKGHGTGFLTKRPSKRAREIINRLKDA